MEVYVASDRLSRSVALELDAEALWGLPIATVDRLGRDMREQRDWRRDERHWCHDWQSLICGGQREGSVLTDDEVWRGQYPPVPNYWDSFEFPGAFMPKRLGWLCFRF